MTRPPTIDLRIHAGALSGHLDTLLAEFAKDPARAPLQSD